MKNKKRSISKYLKTNFIIFSLLIVVVFLCTNFLIQVMGDRYLLEEAKHYFADTLIDENYNEIDISHISSIGGWISILDDELRVIYTTKNDEVEAYTNQQLIALSKGELVQNSEKMYASMKYFLDEGGRIRLGIVCIPARYVNVTVTISNIKSTILNILLIYIGGMLIMIAGYIIVVWGLSCYMKKELTNPIYMLKNALSDISHGNYSTRVNFESVSEFVEIKDSFNSMAQRLFDMEEEKKISYQQRQQLLTDIGHDLKTPITIIQGYSAALLEGRVSADKRERSLQIINKNAENVAELIEVLLDYTRFDCAEYKLSKKKTDLGEFLRRIIAEKMFLFDENQIHMQIAIPDEHIEATIDIKIMKRAIVNLLHNIIQHNPKRINAFVKLDENKKIIIADSGNRIPDDLKEKIFEPFVCGDVTRNPERNNSGLGLSIAKKIIEMHGGRLHLEQEWNEYTKAFIIEL